ncbi:hypothetical protein LF1_18400 [Rubripirellula obstinata]|uniref:Tetratricopeptide repeat protein n=1 Tax=Rubripirellula obstinata TaxID=406547 RepID=A0A5B1CIA1_9BACT|nr:hypothetical protein [Rubripirellula obstinata]KAA1259310.1 hypothetical protein LF1_18400 [Rubripirellula obstinata]
MKTVNDCRSLRCFACLPLCILFLTGCFLTGCLGCARSVGTIDSARSAFHNGDLVAAEETLSQIASKQGGDSHAAALDLAMVRLSAGDLDGAESELRRLRNQFDELPETNLLCDSASMLTDDTVRVFRPAGYEEVMIRAMLAVCSLAGDSIDAEAYALQASMQQNKLRDRAEQRGIPSATEKFEPIAIAPYLRGVLREATHHDYDDAAKAYQLVSAVRPQFGPASADIQRATTGTHSRPGHGVLYVIACVGEGPRLVETEAPTTSDALAIASVALSASQNNSQKSNGGKSRAVPVIPNIASVKVPRVVIPETPIASVGVRVNGVLYGATQTLTDVGDLAIKQTEAEMPWTLARAVMRRTTKELAVAKIGDSMGLGGGAGSLFQFAAASAWAGTENADTRCWALLPREIQVLRAELPSGQHDLVVEPLGWNGQPIGSTNLREIEMVDGRNTYAVVIAPGKVIYQIGSAK